MMISKKRILTQEYLREILHYDPEKGSFHWTNHKSNHKKGQPAGHINRDGYLVISIRQKQYYGQQIAFLYMEGYIPKLIDHKNRDKLDNYWCNLRVATQSQNIANTSMERNNSSGYKGIIWIEKSQKWQASIVINAQKKYLGRFKDIKDAISAYSNAAKEIYGEFACIDL